MSIARTVAIVLLAGGVASAATADEPTPADALAADGVAGGRIEQLADAARGSIVVITTTGRAGRTRGVGTGFAISRDGLVATNMHVIGEARPIVVQTADGREHQVTEIHASDRHRDLAVLRIDADDLVPLELGDSDLLQLGRPVVALGNPLGLEHSVVAGIVSQIRDIDGLPMIQLAMPIEPGNSGGPLLDIEGRVQGILTMKSRVTQNLGFAVTINSIKPLLDKPNPVPISRWLTIGALDEGTWEPLFDARWRQRAGRIVVDGVGSGFGGRSLCLYHEPPPEAPYEVAVTVKLDDESGAAGLVFASDGGNRHYGFYPSGGSLRLTCFEGPDVSSWTILAQEQTPHYRPGEWNTLKVRHEAHGLVCSVNGHVVIESDDDRLHGGRVGLAKFRDTYAEFKGFRVAPHIRDVDLPAEQLDRISRLIDEIPTGEDAGRSAVEQLLPDAPHSTMLLRQRAQLIERHAAELRRLADRVHVAQVLDELAQAAAADDADLLTGALLIARLDNDEVDVAAYVAEVASMAREIAERLPPAADDEAKLAALDRYLFEENGFHGSRTEYYNRANSYLNEVIDDREGLPIALSVLYIDLAGRLGVKIAGISTPGHFIVQHVPASGEPQLIDVFDSAKRISREYAEGRVTEALGRPPAPEYFEPVSHRDVLVRMLSNLLGISRQTRDVDGMLRYLDAILVIRPDGDDYRWMRALTRAQAGDFSGALVDADWLAAHQPPGLDMRRLMEFRQWVADTAAEP